jgi:hypothetical protein
MGRPKLGGVGGHPPYAGTGSADGTMPRGPVRPVGEATGDPDLGPGGPPADSQPMCLVYDRITHE